MKNRTCFPRTLVEAFGPYANGPIEPMPDKEPMHKHDKIVLIGTVLTLVVGVAGYFILVWIGDAP